MREAAGFATKRAGPLAKLAGHEPRYRGASLVHGDNWPLVVCEMDCQPVMALAVKLLHFVRAVCRNVLDYKHSVFLANQPAHTLPYV